MIVDLHMQFGEEGVQIVPSQTIMDTLLSCPA